MSSSIGSDTVTISFPDLSPAEASILAQELAAVLAEDGVPQNNISRARAKADAQDLGSIVLVAAGAYLFDLAKDAAGEFVKGAANKAGGRAMEAILRKWGTRAEIKKSSGECVVIGEQHRRAAQPRTLAQAQTLADLKTLGVVILGASQFPHYPADRGLDNEAFKRSAEIAKQLFSPEHTVFNKAYVLDLFDLDLRPDDIVDKIEEHVTGHADMRDVILYYCGHGDFLRTDDRAYYLMLKGTRPGREVATGLKIKDFRQMLEQNAHLLEKRCTFVLDSCFAGAAVVDLQSSVDTTIEQQVADLPSHGFAILTAADRKYPAIGRGSKGATMFTGALAEVLMDGPNACQMSLADLCEATRRQIKQTHGQDGVLPQCHAPGQTDGDVSRVPMFVAAGDAAHTEPDSSVTRNYRTGSNAPSKSGGMTKLATTARFSSPQHSTEGAHGQWRSLNCTSVLNGHTGEIVSFGATKDLRFAITHAADNTVRFWDVGAARELWRLPMQHTADQLHHTRIADAGLPASKQPSRAFLYQHGTSRIASPALIVGSDIAIVSGRFVVSLSKGKILEELPVTMSAISEESCRGIEIGKTKFVVWEIGSTIRQVCEHPNYGGGGADSVFGISFSPSGTHVASSCGHEKESIVQFSRSSSVRLWDSSTGALLSKHPSSNRVMGIGAEPEAHARKELQISRCAKFVAILQDVDYSTATEFAAAQSDEIVIYDFELNKISTIAIPGAATFKFSDDSRFLLTFDCCLFKNTKQGKYKVWGNVVKRTLSVKVYDLAMLTAKNNGMLIRASGEAAVVASACTAQVTFEQDPVEFISPSACIDSVRNRILLAKGSDLCVFGSSG